MSSSSSSSEDSEYGGIQVFFPAKECEEMPSYEKDSCRNAKRNYNAMQQAESESGPSCFTSQGGPAPRYSLRAASRGKVYAEDPALDDDDFLCAEDPALDDDDDFLFCDDCGREWEGDCPEHGPLDVIPDSEVDDNDPERALHSVPSCLSVHDSKIPGAGQGVWTKQAIPRRVRFGPYEGDVTQEEEETGYGWGIRREGKTVHCVDALDPAKSNWMRFVNCARNKGEENLDPYQYQGKLYYRTVCDIPANTELLLWYGDSYAMELGIDPQGYRREPARAFNGTFPCEQQCGMCFISPLLLAQHRRSGHCHAEIRRRRACGAPGAEAPAAGVSTSGAEQAAGQGEDQQRTQAEAAGGKGKHRCGVCGAAFKAPSNLRMHMRVHTGEKPFICATCGAAFRQKGTLQKHMRTHTGEKPFSCVICGAAFKENGILHRHVRTHTGEKPFSCATCGAAFRQNRDLQEHLRTHTGEKPFRCATCGAAFRQKGTLQEHMRTHTEEKPFSCATCRAAFKRNRDLKTHMRKVHKEQP